MFNEREIENIVAIDVETVSLTETIDKLTDRHKDLWIKRAEYLRRKHDDNKDLSDNEIFEQKAALQAEFGKIICITVGFIRFKDGQPILKTKSYSDESEHDLLKSFAEFIDQLDKKRPDDKLYGHNIKRFDIPFIGKRMLINGIAIPNKLQVYDKKPWELSFIDSAEIFSFGAWNQSFTSLDILTSCLDIPSPKNDIDGSKVGEVYWKENDLSRIVEYCELDVVATLQVLLKFANKNIVNQDNIINV